MVSPTGGVAERFIAAAFKAVGLSGSRGFESRRLRHSKGQHEHTMLALDFTQLFRPALVRGSPCDFGALLAGELFGPRLTAPAPQLHRRHVLAVVDEFLVRLASRDPSHRHGIPDHISRALLASWANGHVLSSFE